MCCHDLSPALVIHADRYLNGWPCYETHLQLHVYIQGPRLTTMAHTPYTQPAQLDATAPHLACCLVQWAPKCMDVPSHHDTPSTLRKGRPKVKRREQASALRVTIKEDHLQGPEYGHLNNNPLCGRVQHAYFMQGCKWTTPCTDNAHMCTHTTTWATHT
jgi:hypothetical protein